MKTTRKQSINGMLESVIDEINEIGYLKYSVKEMRGMGVKYAQSIFSYLNDNGYIDKMGKKIKHIESINILENVREYYKKKYPENYLKPRIRKNQSINGMLELILQGINDCGYLRYTGCDLNKMGVKYSRHLKSFLFRNGYIDENNKLIKHIDVKYFVESLAKYKLSLNGNLNHRFKDNQIPENIKDIEKTLSSYEDEELVKELRNRGYEVSAIKTIAL